MEPAAIQKGYCCLLLTSSINSFWISRRVVWRASILLLVSSILFARSSILADSDLSELVDPPIRLVDSPVGFVYAG